MLAQYVKTAYIVLLGQQYSVADALAIYYELKTALLDAGEKL